MLGEVGRFDGAWPHSDDVMPAAWHAWMIRAMASSTAASRSSKSSAQISESRSTPSMSWVRSFEPIETPSMPSAAYSGMRYDDRRHLGHDPAQQAALVGPAGCASIGSRQASSSQRGAHERDHEVQVRRLLAHPGEQLELEREQVGSRT